MLRKPARWALTRGLVDPKWGWFHSRVRGGIALWDGGGQQTFDFGQRKSAAFVGTPSWGVGTRGILLDHEVDTTERYVNLGTSSRLGPGSVGLFWFGIRSPSTGDNESLIERDFTSAGEPFYVYRMIFASSEGVSVQYNIGGTRFNNDPHTQFNFLANTTGDIGVSIKDGLQQVWVKGILEDTATNSGTITDYGQDTRIGSSQLFSTHENQGKTYCAYIVEGGFSEAEYFQLHDDPFGPLYRVDEVGTVVGLPAPPAGGNPLASSLMMTGVGF